MIEFKAKEDGLFLCGMSDGVARSSPRPPLAQGCPLLSALTKDQMIDQFDSEERGSPSQPLGELEIFSGRFEAAARMVVRHHCAQPQTSGLEAVLASRQ